MKKQNLLMTLFLAAFMLLLFGNVSSADPMMAPGTAVDISHCADMPPTTRPACEAAAHGGPGHHDSNMAPPDLVGVGPAAPVEPPMYGGPNDHHVPAPVGVDGDGPDCANLPTPDEVAACWDAKNQHANQHHVEVADPGHHPPAIPAGPCPPDCGHDPNMAPPDLVGVGSSAPVDAPMYGGPNDHHLEAPVNMDGGHDCAGLPTPEEVAACWDTKNQHANEHHIEMADPGHHPPGMPGGAH